MNKHTEIKQMTRQELLNERTANQTEIHKLQYAFVGSRRLQKGTKAENIRKDALRARNAEITKLLNTLDAA